jgi:hypothetical protein
LPPVGIFSGDDCANIGAERRWRRPESLRPRTRGEVIRVPKISVEVPRELLEDLDEHVGEDGKFVNRSEAVRASVRKTLDILDEVDARHGRLDDE